MAWHKTSEKSSDYNCIAWALGFDHILLWPEAAFDMEWPFPRPETCSVADFAQLFALFGYERCNTEMYEAGFEKIALYSVTPNSAPEHAARQLQDGRWTSKLGGGGIDGIHDALADFPTEEPYNKSCRLYGGARFFFRRPRGQYPSYEQATMGMPRDAGAPRIISVGFRR